MKDLVSQMLSDTFESMRRKTEAREHGRRRAARVTEALERAVEGTDPAIRYLPGYRKKLQEAIAISLEYTERFIAEIPGAIEVSRRTFVSDPCVNAFFVNVKDLQTVFSTSSEIREFLEACRHEIPHCYALLCMHKSEKTVMGVELDGEVLKRDVSQTAVSFSDHRIYAPAPTEAETREGLRQCLFEGLVTHALGRIMHLKLANHRLQQERQALQARLRYLQKTPAHGPGPAPAGARTAGGAEDIMARLRKIEGELLNSRLSAPQVSLNEVHAVFRRPDNFIRIRKSTLTLSKMGIRIDLHSPQPSNVIHLTEVEIGEELPRVVTLAKFPRDELLPLPEFLAQRIFS